MKRREFIAGLGSAAAWPVAARAQRQERKRRVGVLMPVDENEPDNRRAVEAFAQVLHQWASTEGRDVLIDTRWGNNDPSEIRRQAEQLIALAPDVIVTSGDATVAPLLQSARTVPIVFNNVTDPWRWLRRKPGAAGRQCHRIFEI